jgi:hypothetical protein
MATRLRNIVINRVDLVDKGANYDARTGDGAHVTLFKRAPIQISKARAPIVALVEQALTLAKAATLAVEVQQPLKTFNEVLATSEAHEGICDLSNLWWTFTDLAHSIVERVNDGNRDTLLRDAAVQFTAAVLAGVDEFAGGLAASGASADDTAKAAGRIAETRAVILRSMGAALAATSQKEPIMAKTEAELAIEKAAADKLAADNAETIQKAVDAAVTKAVAEAKAPLEAELAKANDAAKVEKSARRTREMLDVIAKSFAGLPDVKPETDAEVLKALEDKAPTEFARVKELLEKAAVALKASKAFSEVGKGNGAAAVVSGSAAEEVFAKADVLVAEKKSATREQAIDAMISDPANKDLMKRYFVEQGARK